MIPAMNNADTEVSVRKPIRIKPMLGGIKEARVPPVAIQAVDNLGA
jgi:hypothetical protein